MQTRFPHLFQPLQIGKLRLKNRIAMAPMGFPALSDETGLPTQRYIDYFTERARGGAGLLITGMLKVEESIEYTTRRRGPIRKEFIRPFADLTEAVHALGAKIFVQVSAGFGYQVRAGSTRGAPVAPSAIPSFGDRKLNCRALTTQEVEQLVRNFGDAAEILASAGVDGVEVHGHAGFLIDQFTTALWNKRDDKYGGDLRGRMQFPIEILREIKKRMGEHFPVQYRYGLKHYMKSLDVAGLPGEQFVEIGRDIPEGLEMARILEGEGYDALAVDAGSLTGHYWAHPPMYQKHGCLMHLAALTKEAVKIPVVAVGRLDVPELAEQVLANGEADVVSLARGLLADPQWPNKVREGKVEDIRPCIGCHQACSEAIHGREINSCTVNPAAGRESTHTLKPAETRRRILVAGGGVAGMEAARVTASRGHEVVLYERSSRLGGHLLEAAVPEEKKDLERLNTWYQRQLDELGVQVKLQAEVTPDVVESEQPEVVVVATGSRDVIPSVPGIRGAQVMTSTEVLLGLRSAGQSVAVVGGGENGCEVALWLAQQGRNVTLVEMQAKLIAIPVARSNRNMLIDSLALHNVEVLTSTALREVVDGAVLVAAREGEPRRIACDSVVLAVGMRAEDQLYESLLGSYPGLVYGIGDSQGPHNIMKAVWDAYEVGRTV
ncbi:FAD-dependent oxidoreductase [Ramlibacter sp. G-1-2-2]|uniref:FAD-dependent oxidoreductase n=1 Tax=Ramlibacter agri TaxID=2728837 RepID=A0A848GZV5_9BURK|nr:FAD-dependent oxidoreductase [Ramlibacter agri]NML42829.1 FAD-dependent oxidoreductase [Ramlibacter agri]